MLVLLGVFVVILGFALKKDPLLIIFVSAVVTAITGKLPVLEFFKIVGKTFVSNRAMGIFIIVMLVTGTLERNGLKEIAAKLIGKAKNASPSRIIGLYGIMRIIFASFNVSFGGVAGFVRPIIYPMTIGAVQSKYGKIDEQHAESLKGMSAGMENIAWFFGQVLFIGGSGALLVRATLDSLGYKVELASLAKAEIPVAIFALICGTVVFTISDRKLSKKLYSKKQVK
ncbi:MAG: 5-oxoproline transporter, DUF969 family subunit [Fusobacteriaceae bacterium]